MTAGAPVRPPSGTVDPAKDSRGFRTALGRFVTGVTVVTVASTDGPVGMTANSFASLSLDPPLVLWAPARAARRFRFFEAARHFAIHILGADQRALAEGFSRADTGFAGVDWQPGPAGVPHLCGCLARFDCTLHASHDGGDHLIVVGRVTRLVHGDGAPLVFHAGELTGLTR